MKKYAIVLAAGKGLGMNSRDPEHSKVSYPILGKPMISYVVDALKAFDPNKIITVVGFGGEITSKIVENDTDVVWQHKILGTGHAVLQAKPLLEEKEGLTLVIYGDTPLIPVETIEKILHRHLSSKADMTVVTAVLNNPSGYGRAIRQEKTNKLVAIREETDCQKAELEITEVNTGICIVDNKLLFKYIDRLSNKNARKLYYLSELVELFNQDGYHVDTFVASEMSDVFGINNRIQLAYASKVIRKRVNNALMLSGVSIEDPETTYISPDVKIGKDTVIMPNTTILGKCEIGENNFIGPNTYISNSKIGDDNRLPCTWVIDYEIGSNIKSEPFTKFMNKPNKT